MSNIATRQNRLPVATYQEAQSLAVSFAQAHVMGAANDAEGMLALVLITEVGLVKAEATYHIMMGRLSKKAEAILGDFIRAGGTYEIVRRDADCAEVVASFGATKNMPFRFTWDDACLEPFVYAGGASALKKPAHKRTFREKYATPRSRMQMLWARLVSDMGRALCPDSTQGLYPPEIVADFDELQTVRDVSTPLGADEIARRVAAATQAEAVDYTVCPIGGEGYEGKTWDQFDNDALGQAIAGGQLDDLYITEINKVLNTRKAPVT